MNSEWLIYGVPALALAIGGLGYGYLWLASRAFDRRWHHPAPGE